MLAGPHNRWLDYQDMAAHGSLAYAPNSKKEGCGWGEGSKSSGSNRPAPSPPPLKLDKIRPFNVHGGIHCTHETERSCVECLATSELVPPWSTPGTGCWAPRQGPWSRPGSGNCTRRARAPVRPLGAAPEEGWGLACGPW
jgi:hypothetical protein